MYAKIKDKIYILDKEVDATEEETMIQKMLDNLKDSRQIKIDELNAGFDRLEAELKTQLKELTDTKNAISN